MMQVAARGKMQFDDLRLGVIFMIIWLVKCLGANPTVTLDPVSSVYFDVGGSMSLVCEVDQDIGVTKIYFNRNNSIQVSISPSTCTAHPAIIGDPRTYSSICSQGMVFTLKINGVRVDDHRTTWSCQVLTSSGTCVSSSSVRCGSPDLSILLRVAVTSLFLTDISGQTLSNPVSVRVGSETYFKCSTSPNGSRPKATFRWYKRTGSQAAVEIEDQTIISSTPDPIPVPGQPETDLVISNSMLTLVGNKQDQNDYIFCGGRDETNTGDEKLSGMAQLNIVYPPVVSLSPNSSVYNVTKDRQSFVLTCNVVDANPQPQQNGFQWLYKSVLVTGQTSSSYTIQSVQKSHDGEYKCTASNLYGTGTSQPLYLVVQYGPSIAQLGIKNVEEGDNLSVTCNVSASPPAIVMWTRSGGQTSQSAVLSLPSISRNQEGNYTCTASNALYPTGLSPDFKQASETLSVQVFYGPGNSTRLNRDKLLYEVEEGQTAETITCTAACKPACSYIWFKDNTEMYNISTLSLGTVQRNCNGNYTCKAYNTVLEQLRQSTVVIQVRIKFAPIVKIQANAEGTNPYIVKIGQMKILLTCVVKAAYPHPTSFIWTHNGSEIPNNGESVYNITEVIRQSSGTWGCRGVNSIGTPEQSTFKIDVQYGPIISPIANRTSVEGGSLTVTCVVDANPTPYLVSWTKDNNFRQNSSDLRIDNLTRYDNGTYKCTAHNKIHPSGLKEEVLNTMEEFYLDVHYGATIINLSVVGNNVVNENSTASLKCYVDSNPSSNITWIKEEAESFLQTNYSVLQSQFTFHHVQCIDTDNYTCKASNGLATPVEKWVPLFISCHPRPDNRFPPKTQVYGKRNMSAVLRYTVIAYPLPTFTWMFVGNGSESRGLPESVRQLDSGLESELIFMSLDINHFGNYSVTANNSLSPPAKEVFEIIPADVPDVPSNVTVIEVAQNSAKVQWVAGYSGGPEQMFHIFTSAGDITKSVSAYDPGDNKIGTAVLESLLPNTKYSIYMIANNSFGSSMMTQNISFKTLEESESTNPTVASISAVAGGIGAGIVVILLVVVAIFLWRRYQHPCRHSDEDLKERKGRCDQDSGLIDNPVYDGTDNLPCPSSNTVAAGTEYAAVVKSKHTQKVIKVEDPNNVYAQVDKKKNKTEKKGDLKGKPGKKNKGASKGKPGKTPRGEIYENATIVKRSIKKENVYENSENVNMDSSGENVYENPAATTAKDTLGNKDGLVYADLMLGPPTTKAGKPVIHGLDNRTEYADIAYGKRGEPLPESDEEKESYSAKKNNDNTDE